MPKGVKPEKPDPEFPLYPHNRGRWAKKINGKLKYFGHWDDPQGALIEYEKSLLSPQITQTVGLSVEWGFNAFLTAKKKAVEAKELAPRSFADYKRTLRRFMDFTGKDRQIENLQPRDFNAYKDKIAQTLNPVAVGNEVTRIKTCLKWLKGAKWIKEIEVGPDFRKPTALVARRHKRSMGLKLFSPEQIHAMLDESGLRMKAMILLGINAGYHNSDCETITLATIKAALKSGIVEHVREKTEIDRACPLWDETREALRQWIARRPKSNQPYAFVLHDGRSLSTQNKDIAKRFRIVRESSGIADGGFSWLRKTFATHGSDLGDQVAVDFIMGHVDSTVPGIYRQLIKDGRLHKVASHVHSWLFS